MGRKITLKKKAAIYKAYRMMKKENPELKRDKILQSLVMSYNLKRSTIEGAVQAGEALYAASERNL